MKFCSHCGTEINDDAVVCVNCGCPVTNEKKSSNDQSTMKTIILIFLILGCISIGWLIIPLAWCIPMTISIKRKMDNNEPIGVGLKVCTLLFVNTIAGILLLCLSDNE